MTWEAIKSAYLGIKDLDLKGSIVFLDNDNLYSFSNNFYKNYNEPFIGYIENNSTAENFSFININNNYITEIKEKKKISNYTCCGVYGFKDLNLQGCKSFKNYYFFISYWTLHFINDLDKKKKVWQWIKDIFI